MLLQTPPAPHRTTSSSAPLVSIVIPTYNCAFLAQAIESALAQTYPNVEIIVVDDGSSRNVEKVDPYLDKVRYVRKSNGGTGSALNAGIAQARGEYFAWLSSDDLYEPKKVARQMEFMAERDAVVSYTFYRLIDSAGKILGEPIQRRLPSRLSFLWSMQRGCHINGCTMMFPLQVFREVGDFNPSLRFTQDYDLWLRILRRYEFHYLDEPLVRYRVHDNMSTKKHEAEIGAEVDAVRRKHRWALYGLMGKELLHCGRAR